MLSCRGANPFAGLFQQLPCLLGPYPPRRLVDQMIDQHGCPHFPAGCLGYRGRAERQSELLAKYCFTCSCERCEAGAGAGSSGGASAAVGSKRQREDHSGEDSQHQQQQQRQGADWFLDAGCLGLARVDALDAAAASATGMHAVMQQLEAAVEATSAALSGSEVGGHWVGGWVGALTNAVLK